MDSGVTDLGRFIVGDSGFRRLYRTVAQGGPASGAGDGARTLIRETPEGLRACIYYPDALVRGLEAQPPQRGLDERNVDAFATLVEELDHLLVVAERVRLARPFSLFELELHANVSKHLVVSRFLAGSAGRLDDARRAWLRHHLFGKVRYCDADPDVRQRYRDAARWAVRLLDGLGGLVPAQRLALLRRFHAASVGDKLGCIARLAA